MGYRMKTTYHMLYKMAYPFLLLTAILLMATTGLRAQSKSDRLFGYSQVTTPGIAKADEIENLDGTVTKTNERGNNKRHFIYLSTLAKTSVYPIEVWIKGEAFSARPESIAGTPVEISGPVVMGRPQKITLVPKTTQKVTRLIPIPLMEGKSTNKGATLAQENELVVVYKQGGKTIYKTLKTLKELSTKALK